MLISNENTIGEAFNVQFGYIYVLINNIDNNTNKIHQAVNVNVLLVGKFLKYFTPSKAGVLLAHKELQRVNVRVKGGV